MDLAGHTYSRNFCYTTLGNPCVLSGLCGELVIEKYNICFLERHQIPFLHEGHIELSFFVLPVLDYCLALALSTLKHNAGMWLDSDVKCHSFFSHPTFNSRAQRCR